MVWRLARGLIKLRDQVNEAWPQRHKDSDGSIGNAEHSARKSDHNPDADGVVHALDLTHDPKNGFDSYAFAQLLLERQDHRLSYVISNRRIGAGPHGPEPGVWRPYHGVNPHDHHCHVSILAGATADDFSPWSIGGLPAPSAEVIAAHVEAPATLRRGDRGAQVEKVQHALHIKVDGAFGQKTFDAVREFQGHNRLVADGIVGPQTWKVLAE